MFTSAGLSLCLPLMGIAPTAALVFATLVVLGALDGLTDVAMNAQAVELQRRVGTSIITRFHALWSAGASPAASSPAGPLLPASACAPS